MKVSRVIEEFLLISVKFLTYIEYFINICSLTYLFLCSQSVPGKPYKPKHAKQKIER